MEKIKLGSVGISGEESALNLRPPDSRKYHEGRHGEKLPNLFSVCYREERKADWALLGRERRVRNGDGGGGTCVSGYTPADSNLGLGSEQLKMDWAVVKVRCGER